jgi:hypothetical protein
MPYVEGNDVSWYHLGPLLDFRLAEADETPPRTVPEQLVRCLWFDRRWRPPVIRTLTGQEVIVHDPGHWNLQAGPDFQRAVIAFDSGPRQRGDVEIHRYASGWTAHRHHLDPRYNRVILHVCLWHDRRSPEITRADGQHIPQIALLPWLPRPLAAYQADIVLEEYPYKHAPTPGQCYEVLRRLDRQTVWQFLSRAGELRLFHRVARWAGRATEVGLAQVMYEAIMRSLGSAGYRLHFQHLARLLPWHTLQTCLADVPAVQQPVAAEALLFGLAGMIGPDRDTPATADAETEQYLETLLRWWTAFPSAVRARAWQAVNWRQTAGRPANTPERRLAAMARLLAQYQGTDLLAAALARCHSWSGRGNVAAARALRRALEALFGLPGGSYWNRHTRLGSRPLAAQRLIGVQRSRTMVIDAVLPVLVLAAQQRGDSALQDSLLACYRTAPRLPDNALLRYMARRLLGNDPALLDLVSGAPQQQGVMQIFYDHCDKNEGDCQGCDFPLSAAHRNW